MSLDPFVDASDPAVVDVGHLLYRSLLKLDSTGYPDDRPRRVLVRERQRSRLHSRAATRPRMVKWLDRSQRAMSLPRNAFARLGAGERRGPCEPVARGQGLRIGIDNHVHAAVSAIIVRCNADGDARSFRWATSTHQRSRWLRRTRRARCRRQVPTTSSRAAALAVVLQPNPARRTAVRASRAYELRLFLRFADAANVFSQGSIDALLAIDAGGAVDADAPSKERRRRA